MRIEKLRKKFKDLCDAVIITNEKNIRYFCGFDFTDGCLVITQTKALLFCDFRYIEAAKMNADPDFHIIMFSGRRSDWLAPILKENNIARLIKELKHIERFTLLVLLKQQLKK